MSRFIEIFSDRFRRANKEQSPRQPRIIESATGERQRLLENTCKELLGDEIVFTEERFLQFTTIMIELVGGREEPSKESDIEQSSHPLHDSENSQSLSFKRAVTTDKLGDVTEGAAITVQNGKLTESIVYGRETGNNIMRSWGPEIIFSLRLDTSPTISSFLTGETEEIIPNKTIDHYRDIEDFPFKGKNICNRILDTYLKNKSERAT